ncbi:MAG: aromatic ring-hydroxylating dioxygenase subunit alpha [Pedobacter sp.]|nr:MAG: aromatic ring-hydroxylating dioxygenase subunit alpha [Pedobacter sp.]
MLKKSNYYDQEHFDFEKEKIFSQNWVFGCIQDEVKNNNDFVTIDVAGKPIVIQNFKGIIKAFLNVCSHRFNKIQTTDFGKRPLTCGYHCWSFNQDGVPFFVPKKETFNGLVDADGAPDSAFNLTEFRTETCGNFVFINLSNSSDVTLEQHLGNHYNKLIDISQFIGNKIHFGKIEHKANWKILIENVLECYHCSVVHKDSLFGKLGVGSMPISEIEYSDSHSSCHFPKIQRKSDEKKRKILAFLDERSFKHDSFYHIFIFPNLVISSTEGASFYVGQLCPVSASETELRVRFFEPNIDYTEVNQGIRDILADESVKLGYEILEEDRAILENIQKGVQFTDSVGIVSEEEIRIKYFFEKYLKTINN